MSYARVPSDALIFELPEPPSMNQMIDLAKRRVIVRGKAIPISYDIARQNYEIECIATLRTQGFRTPAESSLERWRLIVAHFRLHQLRDWTELLASLKWPIDVLVRLGFVKNDSPREMAPPCLPTQIVDRHQRGVTIIIAPWQTLDA